MNTFKQLTRYSLEDISPQNKTFYSSRLGIVTAPYKVISSAKLGGNPFKLSYICDGDHADYPIYITINGIERVFFLNYRGIIEVQPEMWQDVNDEDSNEEEAIFFIDTIEVPAEAIFKINYMLKV
jgi:hypothetical protein